MDKGKAQSLPKAEAKGGASRTQRSWRELQKKADGKTLKIIAIDWKAPQGLFILWVRQLKTERLELVQDHTQPGEWDTWVWNSGLPVPFTHMEGCGWGGGIKGKQSAHALPPSNRAALVRSVLHEAFRKG